MEEIQRHGDSYLGGQHQHKWGFAFDRNAYSTSDRERLHYHDSHSRRYVHGDSNGYQWQSNGHHVSGGDYEMKRLPLILVISAFFWLLGTWSAFGTLSGLIVWEIRSNGNDNNGGGFKTGASGTDYSQQTSPQYALTSVTTAGAGATFLLASASADMVGNIAHVVSGTNFTAGFYEITSVSVGVSVTCDANICTGVGNTNPLRS